jgi:hypothetical protein
MKCLLLTTLMVVTLVMVMTPAVPAGVMTITATQSGGFYIDKADNSPAFQNYFVGYGTSPGHERTSERRSFFWFDIPAIDGTITGATLHLALPFGGLIFGIAPGPVPPPGVPPVHDLSESFQLSATPFSPSFVTRTDLTLVENAMVFDSLMGPSIAGSVDFSLDGTPPPGATVEPFGLDIAIPLNAAGTFFLTASEGSSLVMSGWMPSWSHDERLAPLGSSTLYYEASELIFGLSDVHSGMIPHPRLDLFFSSPAPVPEPCLALPIAAAFGFWGVGRKLKRLRRAVARSGSV